MANGSPFQLVSMRRSRELTERAAVAIDQHATVLNETIQPWMVEAGKTIEQHHDQIKTLETRLDWKSQLDTARNATLWSRLRWLLTGN